jgi:hypothetical protein
MFRKSLYEGWRLRSLEYLVTTISHAILGISYVLSAPALREPEYDECPLRFPYVTVNCKLQSAVGPPSYARLYILGQAAAYGRSESKA